MMGFWEMILNAVMRGINVKDCLKDAGFYKAVEEKLRNHSEFVEQLRKSREARMKQRAKTPKAFQWVYSIFKNVIAFSLVFCGAVTIKLCCLVGLFGVNQLMFSVAMAGLWGVILLCMIPYFKSIYKGYL